VGLNPKFGHLFSPSELLNHAGHPGLIDI